MDANEEMIRTLYEEPNKAYDYFSNNYHIMTNSEKVDITKELLYAIYDMCDEETHKRVLMTAAENLADHNDIDLYDNEMKQTEEVLTSESCLEGSTKENYTNRLLILRDTSLQEGYRKPEYQYFYATGGFGCNPDSLGTKVYGSFLYDNVYRQFYRSDFLGVADPAKLSEWASKKMEDRRRIDADIILEKLEEAQYNVVEDAQDYYNPNVAQDALEDAYNNVYNWIQNALKAAPVIHDEPIISAPDSGRK